MANLKDGAEQEMIESLVNVPEEVQEEVEEEEEPRTPEGQARYERWLQGVHGHPDDQVDLYKVFGLERPVECSEPPGQS